MPATTGTLGDRLIEVWKQVLVDEREELTLDGDVFRVGRTRSQGLRTVAIRFREFAIEGIEQNPRKESRWAQLAQEGKRILQFRCGGAYVANVCEGALLRYPAWKSKGLPE